MLIDHDKLSIAGEFYTSSEDYQRNGRNGKWRDGFRIKGYIRTDQLPARVTYNQANAQLDGIYYRLKGDMIIDSSSITFLPDGEEVGIRIFNGELPPEGLDFTEIDTYNRAIYKGFYKPGRLEEE